MVTSIVSREDTVYKAVPDLAMCGDGTLVCTYRESLFHLFHPFSRIVVQSSRDGGLNWGPKQVVDECPDYLKDGGFNTPRLLSVGGNELILACDWIPPREGELTPNSEIYLWRSTDGGSSWSSKRSMGIRGHICPGMIRLRSSAIILGASRFDSAADTEVSDAFRSTDGGSTWSAASAMAPPTDGLRPTEPTFVELESGLVVCYLREDAERRHAYKSFSRDEGTTWDGPYPTSLVICRGRPQAGLLDSGEVAITYGFGVSPRLLVLHVETQEIAADPRSVEHVETGHHIEASYRMRSGTLILSTNTFDKTYGAWRHQAFLSTDLGSSWTEPRDVGFSPKLSLSEGAYVHLDDSSLVAYMREEKECICGYKSVSKDNGETWQGPYPTHLLACRGRPYGGLLRSGEVVVMYGFGTTPRQLVMHVETQQIAADPDCVQNSGQHSHLRPAIRRFFIDHDRSIHPDAAYPAWTQLADGDIFAVQYIVDDAPMGHIRSYRISRSDWLLYPEGRLGREDA